VYAVASGKGGVGKSSVTVNLAAALAARGLSVGVLDADIYGHSVPRMMGTTDRPTQVDSMILPPVAHDVKVISIAMFTQGNTPVVWRDPCCTARCSSSWPTCTGAISTSCCSTCRQAPAISRSRCRS
jgi:Mrp family chromosome partitioning ATPase